VLPFQPSTTQLKDIDQHRCCASSSLLASQSTQLAFLFHRIPYSKFKPHSSPPDPSQTINATELTQDKQVDNVTGATQPVTRSAKSQSPTPKFVQKSYTHSSASSSKPQCGSTSSGPLRSAHNPREIWTRFADREWGNLMLPFVDVAERAAADEVTVAEPRLDGGRQRRRVGHPQQRTRWLYRDPASAAAPSSLGFWRVGIAGLASLLPPGARVWIPGGVRLALLAVSGCAHFPTSRQIWRGVTSSGLVWLLVPECWPPRVGRVRRMKAGIGMSVEVGNRKVGQRRQKLLNEAHIFRQLKHSGYPHWLSLNSIFKKYSLLFIVFYDFYSIVFLYSFTSIFNYSLFYIILYNYHILFLLLNNNILNINCKSQFLKNR
jgi:hypothetical protein